MKQITAESFAQNIRNSISTSKRVHRTTEAVCNIIIKSNGLILNLIVFCAALSDSFLALGAQLIAALAFRYLRKQHNKTIESVRSFKEFRERDIYTKLQPSEKERINQICVRCGIESRRLKIISNHSHTQITPSISSDEFGNWYYIFLSSTFFNLFEKKSRLLLCHDCS